MGISRWQKLKNKLLCCCKSKNETSMQIKLEVQGPKARPSAYQVSRMNLRNQESDKVAPKKSGDRRKTLVIEAANLIFCFKSEARAADIVNLLPNQSNIYLKPEDSIPKGKSLAPNKVQEGKPVIRPTFESFINEIRSYYEIIIWTTYPRKVRIDNSVA
jgi:hypothetical protein